MLQKRLAFMSACTFSSKSMSSGVDARTSSLMMHIVTRGIFFKNWSMLTCVSVSGAKRCRRFMADIFLSRRRRATVRRESREPSGVVMP